MKIIVAVDSFKGSLTSLEVGRAVEIGIKKAAPEAEIKIYPMTDGGEGFCKILTDGLGGKIQMIKVAGALGNRVGGVFSEVGNLAIIEVATVAGLAQVPKNLRNPMRTTTFGVGEMILQAVKDGCREFIIGLGGSATNDCGLGMLSALGFKFLDAENSLSAIGINFKISHAAASSGILNCPESHLDMVRFGLVLYGYADTERGNEGSNLGLKPVMKVKSRITAVRRLPAGATISYGRTFELKRDSSIAVIPMGYADGLPRNLSNNFNIKIHEKLCPVLGRICMDMCMADVTDLTDLELENESVKPGDIAVIFDEDLIPLAAKNSGTIIHEILCSPSERVPRVFIS